MNSMPNASYDFRSDNVAGAAPEILEALKAANTGTTAPYGDDEFTRRVNRKFAALFECDVQTFPIATGTGANSVALASLANAYGSVYCHESAHINVYECGAPEFFTGAKLFTLSGHDYKIDADELRDELEVAGIGNPTRVQPFALSLTQPTDFGTLYSVEQIAELCEVAHASGLKIHMDGARFANAVAALDCTPAELTWRSGVDILSFGATKNGAINAEAVIVFDTSLATRIPYLMKRGGQVLSKARFVSAQLERYVADDRWLERAKQANRHAAVLASRLSALPGVSLVAPIDINMIFLRIPEVAVRAMDEGPFDFYKLGREIRLVCRHDQEPRGMDALVECIRNALPVAS